MNSPNPVPAERKPRWGIYTLAFLGLAFLMVVISGIQKHYTLLTLLGLLVGLGGAAVCTYKGMFAIMTFRLPGGRPRDDR